MFRTHYVHVCRCVYVRVRTLYEVRTNLYIERMTSQFTCSDNSHGDLMNALKL